MNASRRRIAAALGSLGAVAGAVVLVVLVAVGVHWLLALIIAAAVCGATIVGLHFTAWRILLRLTGSHAPDGTEEEVLANVLEGLCVNHGISTPELRVIRSDSVNALAAARTPNRAAIVVTTGAAQRLERVELEGLLAHHLCRIRGGDAALETLAGICFAWPLGISSWLRSRAMSRLLPADRSLKADLEAVSLTRYPPGLLSALVTLSGQTAAVPSTTVAALHMWIDEPDWGTTDSTRHPRLDVRIAALNEL